MSLFPFIDGEVDNITNTVIEEDMPLPLYKEIAWDFKSDMPILVNGEFKIVEGDEAIKVWAYKAIRTYRYEHSVYSWDFGCELDSLIGQKYTKDFVIAEAERFIKEAVLINPYILDVNVTDISFSDSLVNANIKLTTIYSQEGEVAELNV